MGVWDGRESYFQFNLPNKKAQSLCFTVAASCLFCPFIFMDLLPPSFDILKRGVLPKLQLCQGILGPSFPHPAWIPDCPMNKPSIQAEVQSLTMRLEVGRGTVSGDPKTP